MMERYGLALGSYISALPLFIVWLVGFVLSLVHWERDPKLSRLTLIATAGFLVTSPLFEYLNARMPLLMRERGLSASQLGAWYGILGVSRSLVSAGLWVLLLVALFDPAVRQVQWRGTAQGSQGSANTKRLSRGGYWIRWAISFPIGLFLGLLTRSESKPLIFAAGAASLAISIYMIIRGVRRMHEVDKSGWFILVPVYNLVLALTAGTPGSNRYGENPKQRGGSDG